MLWQSLHLVLYERAYWLCARQVIYSIGPHFKSVQNGFSWVLTVAEGTTNRWFAGTLILGNGPKIIGWSLYPGNTSLQELPLICDQHLSRYHSINSFCNVSNAINICDGVRFPSQQLETLTKAKVARAILVSDNPTGPMPIARFDCPCIVIGSKDSTSLMNHVKYDTNQRVPLYSNKLYYRS